MFPSPSQMEENLWSVPSVRAYKTVHEHRVFRGPGYPSPLVCR